MLVECYSECAFAQEEEIMQMCYCVISSEDTFR